MFTAVSFRVGWELYGLPAAEDAPQRARAAAQPSRRRPGTRVAAAMRIAIAVFEGAEELDFVGPWEVLAAWRFLYPDDVEVLLVGEDSAPVTCAKGMRVV